MKKSINKTYTSLLGCDWLTLGQRLEIRRALIVFNIYNKGLQND